MHNRAVRKYRLYPEREILLTADELFELPLDTPDDRIKEILTEAYERMERGEPEISAARRDQAKMAAAMAVSGGRDEDEQRKRARDVLTRLGDATNTDQGICKVFGRIIIYAAMNPMSGPSTGAKPEALVVRAMIEAFGLTELATAVYVHLYFASDGERLGSFEWRKLHPDAARP